MLYGIVVVIVNATVKLQLEMLCGMITHALCSVRPQARSRVDGEQVHLAKASPFAVFCYFAFFIFARWNFLDIFCDRGFRICLPSVTILPYV